MLRLPSKHLFGWLNRFFSRFEGEKAKAEAEANSGVGLRLPSKHLFVWFFPTYALNLFFEISKTQPVYSLFV